MDVLESWSMTVCLQEIVVNIEISDLERLYKEENPHRVSAGEKTLWCNATQMPHCLHGVVGQFTSLRLGPAACCKSLY
jgi:hypothetical protein